MSQFPAANPNAKKMTPTVKCVRKAKRRRAAGLCSAAVKGPSTSAFFVVSDQDVFKNILDGTSNGLFNGVRETF